MIPSSNTSKLFKHISYVREMIWYSIFSVTGNYICIRNLKNNYCTVLRRYPIIQVDHSSQENENIHWSLYNSEKNNT